LPKGGTVALGVSITPFDSDDSVKVTIKGLATYEYITDGADSKTFTGRSVILTAMEVNSGLTLHSTYTGSAKPVNTLSLTAANTTAGESATSAVQTISVTDPPPLSAGGVAMNGTGGPAAGTGSANVALLLNYMANAFVGSGNGHGETLIADPSPAQQSLLTQPHH
jgi:hypothetical protein